MSRSVRVEFPGAFYHVMCRGVSRLPVFLDDTDRERYLACIEKLIESGDLVVHAFCLMPNHYHILCETPCARLSRWMRHVNGDYARWFNARHRRVGHLWQGRYKALVVEDGEYLIECSRYIHLNPNRSRITRPAERYRWSSYRNYVGGPAVATWVETGRVLGAFKGDRESYRAFVESGKGEKPVDPFERAAARLVLGGEEFVAKVREILKERPASPEEPALIELRRRARASPEEVEAAVERVFGGAALRRQGRILLYALRRYSWLRPIEIARGQARTPAAVTVATKAVAAEAARAPALASALRRLEKQFAFVNRYVKS